MRAGATTDILLGRRVRRVEVEIAPGLKVGVLEAADAQVVLEESVRGEGDPYAAVLWPSAIAAACRLPELVHAGMRVLDVGAGTGVVAITAARLGAVVTALDDDAFARAVIRRGAELEGVAVAVEAFDVAGDSVLPACDMAVFADVLYEAERARVTARRTLEVLAEGGRVLVSDPARYARAEYERVLQAAGIDVVFGDVVLRAPGDAQPSRVGLALIEPR
jgi:predicted nicotinamide N-methyase